MVNVKRYVVKSSKQFSEYIDVQRSLFDQAVDGTIYYIEIYTSSKEYDEIISKMLYEKVIDENYQKKIVPSILLVFYGAKNDINTLETTLISMFPTNTMFMDSVEKEGQPKVLLFNASDNIHPFIPDYLVFERGTIKIKNIKFNVEAGVPGSSEKCSNIMDITIINKYLLLSYKFADYYEHFRLNLIMPNQENDDNELRLQAFVSNVNLPKVEVYLNNHRIVKRIYPDYGMLLPAVYIKTIDDYDFLKCPLGKRLWNILRGNLSKKAFIAKLQAEAPSEFIPYLIFCRHSFFDEFDDNNKSQIYTKLRTIAYSSNKFYEEYVSKLPFLALFLFSMYDNYFRSESLRRFKGEIGGSFRLRDNDCVLSLQGEQGQERFKIYKKIKDNYDIKNLIDYVPSSNNLDQEKGTEIVFQKTVTAEVFECLSIAEGLLQIVENAVLHANGGLLSMRVYSRASGVNTHEPLRPHNVYYLDETYGESYFNYLKTPFFLEVQLSDFSDKSIPVKFIENISNDKSLRKQLEELKWKGTSKPVIANLEQLLNNYRNTMKIDYFFSEPKDIAIKDDSINQNISLKLFKKIYYRISENKVHHYGLETFNAIVSARNGIFSVCGNNDYYSNANDIIDKAYVEIEELTRKKKTSKNINEDKKNINEQDNNIYKFSQYIENTVLRQYIDKIRTTIIDGKSIEKNKLKNTLEKNKALPGTFYRILLPLNHTRETILISENESVGNNNSGFKETIYSHVQGKPEGMDEPSKHIKDKQKKINSFAQYILKKYDETVAEYYLKRDNTKSVQGNGKEPGLDPICVTCIDLQKCISINEDVAIPDLFESIIKGTLLFALRQTDSSEEAFTPVAIINLSQYQFIEAARIIAIHYGKDYDKSDDLINSISFTETNIYDNETDDVDNRYFYYKRMPIYLKCKDEPKEMVFSGGNLLSVRENMIRTAMKSGSMSDELDTIAFIFERLLHQDKKNAGGSAQ